MALSVTDVGNPQQGGKQGKDKNKDLVVLVYKRLVEINNCMPTLTGRVGDMEKNLEKLKSMGAFRELHGEVQVSVNSMMADVNKEIQALKASEAIKDAKI